VVVLVLATGSVTSGNRQPSDSDVVHDHIRLGKHQIGPITCISIRIGARHVKHAGTVPRGETVGGSSSSSQLSPSRGSTEMISDGCTDANGQVPIKGVSENPLPTAGTYGLWRPCLLVATPCTRASHACLFCDFCPAQVLVTKLQNLLCGGEASRRAAATHGDTSPTKLLAHRGPGNAQLGTDLPQGPALGLQVGCTLGIHGATVMTARLWAARVAL
jgi:hypothetical protein